MNYSPWMTQYVMGKSVFQNDPLSIVDVGASGGIASFWTLFSPFMKAFAFEPLIAECERLNRGATKEKDINYFSYFVGCEDPEVVSQSGPYHAGLLFEKSSAAEASKLQKMNFIKEQFNVGQEVVYANEKISLDAFFKKRPDENVDFIKIDTDGYDYETLYGAQKLIQEKQVLGITIESQFHGPLHPHSNTFRNIDRLMNELGLTLFDLESYRYTKRDLPGEFCYSIPAQTKTGQVLWGEALYFRDPTRKGQILSPTKLLKLACLFEIFNLPDCTAELLNTHKEKLSSIIDVDDCLNLLMKDMGKDSTYEEHLKRFREHTESFYPPKNVALKRQLSRFLKLNFSSKKHFLKQFIKTALQGSRQR